MTLDQDLQQRLDEAITVPAGTLDTDALLTAGRRTVRRRRLRAAAATTALVLAAGGAAWTALPERSGEAQVASQAPAARPDPVPASLDLPVDPALEEQVVGYDRRGRLARVSADVRVTGHYTDLWHSGYDWLDAVEVTHDGKRSWVVLYGERGEYSATWRPAGPGTFDDWVADLAAHPSLLGNTR